MSLTLKTIGFAYEQVIPLFDENIDISLNLEFNEGDFENEEEEKTELLEFKFVETLDFKFTIHIPKEKKKTYFFLIKSYQKKYLEFSTPPPDFI